LKAKKRFRWEKRLRFAEAAFQRKKAEIEAKIKAFQAEMNQVGGLINYTSTKN
jgi:hypothetical protein